MGVLVVCPQIVPSCCIASHQASLIAATGQQFPYEFSYGELRCPAPSAPAVASRSSRAHKFLVKPTAPRPTASVPASASGSGPSFSLIPTTGSTSALPNRRGRCAILEGVDSTIWPLALAIVSNPFPNVSRQPGPAKPQGGVQPKTTGRALAHQRGLFGALALRGYPSL